MTDLKIVEANEDEVSSPGEGSDAENQIMSKGLQKSSSTKNTRLVAGHIIPKFYVQPGQISHET